MTGSKGVLATDSLSRAAGHSYSTYGRRRPVALACLVVLSIVAPLATMAAPVFLTEFLRFQENLEGQGPMATESLWLFGWLVVSTFGADLATAFNAYVLSRAQNTFREDIQTALSALCFDRGCGRTDEGAISNAFTGDADNLAAGIAAFARLFQAGLLLLCGLCLAVYFLGAKAIFFVALVALASPLSTWLSRQFRALTGTYLKLREQRVTLLKTMLNNAKTMRDHGTKAWVRDKIIDIRGQEAKEKTKYYRVNAVSNLFFTATDTVISAAIVLLFSTIDQDFSLATFLPLLLLTKILQTPLGMASIYLSQLGKAGASLERLATWQRQHSQAMACADSTAALVSQLLSLPQSTKVLVRSAQDISVETLFAALQSRLVADIQTRDQKSTAPRVFVNQDVPQFFLGSLRENIEVFGGEATTSALARTKLLTEAQHKGGLDGWAITTHGDNLSTGQQKRVELARAASYDADALYLLEPFSGLDPATTQHVVDQLLLESWLDKTVVVFSQDQDLCPYFDSVLTVQADGTWQTASQDRRPAMAREDLQAVPTMLKASPEQKRAEVDYEGNAKNSLLKYITALREGGGYGRLVSLAVLIILANATTLYQDVAMSSWLENGRIFPFDQGIGSTSIFALFLAAITILSLAINFFQDFRWRASSIEAARTIHDGAINGLVASLGSPKRTVDNKAVLQRLVHDDGILNDSVSWAFEASAYTATKVIITVILAIIVSPITLWPLSLLVVLYTFVQRAYYRSTAPLVSMRAKIYAEILNEAIHLKHWWVMAVLSERISDFRNRLDTQIAKLTTSHNAIAYQELLFSMRGGVLSSLAIIAVAGSVLFLNSGEGSNLALSGVLVLQLFHLNEQLRSFFDASADLQRDLSSLHRIHHIANDRECADATIRLNPSPKAISFCDVHARYLGTEAQVLNGLSLTAKRGSHTVIQGPTGDGKSSVFYALFQDLEILKGEIRWDDIPITSRLNESLSHQLYLMDARTAFFPGSILENISSTQPKPHNLEEIAELLGLKDLIASSPQGWGGDIDQFAQRHPGVVKMLKIAKAFLSPAPVVLLDEPLSHLTTQQQDRVLGLIRSQLRDRIIITIDHERVWDGQHVDVYRLQKGRVADGPTLATPPGGR